jgi:hypothetical protein
MIERLNARRIESLRVGFPAARYDCSLLRMSSFRRMPEPSGSFVDTGLRRCNVMLLIPDRLRQRIECLRDRESGRLNSQMIQSLNDSIAQ